MNSGRMAHSMPHTVADAVEQPRQESADYEDARARPHADGPPVVQIGRIGSRIGHLYPVSGDQQSVRIDAVWSACHQCNPVLPVDDAQL